MAEANTVKKWGSKGDAFVFLHYFGGSALSWQWVAENLSEDYRCIVLNLPGFGDIPALKSPSIQAFADFVREELGKLKVENYTLIGHSMGCKIALQVAADATKGAVRQLILVAPSPPTIEPMPEKEKERMLRHPDRKEAETSIANATRHRLTKAQHDLALETQMTTDPRTWRWWLLEGMAHSIADNLKQLRVPITILASEDDPVIPPEVVQKEVLPVLKEATLITTRQVGHLIPLEVPDWVAAQIRRIVASGKQDTKPALSYWHVWTDDKGISRQTHCELTDFINESIGGGADPQWNNHLLASGAKILFTQLPVGWVGTWHENPKPQWIVTLSGRWFVETMDGQRVEMGPREVSFGGDQNTKPDAKDHKGHLSGTIGEQPAKLMLIQLTDAKWVGAKPGDFA
ncbi:alpha/beta fold hydrolase [Pontibacter sp. HJ8]